MSDNMHNAEVIHIRVPMVNVQFTDGRAATISLLDAVHDLAEAWEPTAAKQREATAGREATPEEAGRAWTEYVALVQAYFAEHHQLPLSFAEARQLDRELQLLIVKHNAAETTVTRETLAALAPTATA